MFCFAGARAATRLTPQRVCAVFPAARAPTCQRSAARTAVSSAASSSAASSSVGAGGVGGGDDESASDAASAPRGVVVTAQANYLRVVVNSDAVRGIHAEERMTQFEDAKKRAVEANAVEDVAKLEAMMADEGATELLCVARALLKKIKRKVLVGDEVILSGIDWVESRGMIDDVIPRRSELIEPRIANVDQALLVFALEQPPLEAKQLTRFLVSMEATQVPFTLVLNKCELLSELEVADWRARLEGWGYDAKIISVATGEGVEELEAALKDKTTVLAGPSGVGKSSLINRLRFKSALTNALESEAEGSDECAGDDDDGDGAENAAPKYITDLDIEGGGGGRLKRGKRSVEDDVARSNLSTLDLQSVKGVGSRSGRGRHTTRHVTLLRLEVGGFLADTPGFGYPSLEGFDTDKLAMCFPEIRNAIANSDVRCTFSDCTHREEPGCVVVDECWEEQRYDLYYELFAEVKKIAENERMAYGRESRVRYKSASGKDATRMEAKLETKSHRRVSRRSSRMETSDLTSEALDHDDDDEQDDDDDDDDDESR